MPTQEEILDEQIPEKTWKAEMLIRGEVIIKSNNSRNA